jgi:hypothetical protein
MFLGVCIDTLRMCVYAPLQKIEDLRAIMTTVIPAFSSIPVRQLSSLVGKLVSLELALGPAILVGTRIVSIQVSEVSDQFGWERVFEVLSDDLRSALKRVSASLDRWNGHPMCTPAAEIDLTSVLAFEDPAGTARKIPNRKLFTTQFTMASDASETTVASYGLSGRLKRWHSHIHTGR